MAEPLRLVGLGPREHVDEVAGSEPLLRPQHGRQGFAHVGRRIEQLRWLGAEVAIATGLRRLAEIGQQGHPTADLRLRQTEQRVEPPVIGGAHLGRGGALVDLAAAEADVVGPEQRQRIGGGAVATRAADLLIIALNRFRQVGMGDPADVGLVDAHPEGDRGDDDQAILALEPRFDDAAILGLHPGMVVAGRMPVLGERTGQRLGLGAGAAIDDPGLAPAGGGEGQDLAPGRVFRLEGEGEVGAVEPVQEGLRLPLEQPRDDFGPGLRVGGGREGGEGHVQRFPQGADPEVVGAEIVAPLADAMGLVHRDERRVRALQHPLGRGGGEAFGRDVEQLQASLLDRLPDRLRLLLRVAGGERARLDSGLLQGTDLIAHQGDERGNNHRQPVAAERGQLETEGLAAAGGHDREDVPPGADGRHDLLLPGAKSVEAEDGGQQVAGRGHGRSRASIGRDSHVAIRVARGGLPNRSGGGGQGHERIAVAPSVQPGEAGGQDGFRRLLPHHQRAGSKPAAGLEG